MNKDLTPKPYFKIDGKEYPIVLEQTMWTIAELTGTLLTKITVDIETAEIEQNDKLFDTYNPDNKLKISFEALRIFENGIPTGEVLFEEDKNVMDHTYFRKEGFEYSLDFFGKIIYKDGWVTVDGKLTPPYSDLPVFDLQVAIQFDAKDLDWNIYRFKSLEEANTADPLIVRNLEIKNPTFKTLPDEVYTFKNLAYLTITNIGNFINKSKLPFSGFDERLGELRELITIQINGAAVQYLPEEIGSLVKLERLSVNFCSLKELPKSVWYLPNLKHLLLRDNAIESISEQINLPLLNTLEVINNQLKTLPLALIKQPSLTSILANGNPLEYLPEEYNSFNGLELDIEDKLRLLDYTYRGADDKGMVPWNEHAFLAEENEALIAPINIIIDENDLTQEREALLSLIKKSVGFNQTSEENYDTIGNHRFGGYPDLPQAIPFPTFYDEYRQYTYHYEFIAQINCEQIGNLQDYLPPTGTLFFFFKSFQYFGYDNKNLAQVIYVEDNKTLESGARFNFDSEDFFELMNGQYTPYKAEAFVFNSAPSFYAHHQNQFLFDGKAKSLKNQEEFLDGLYDKFETPILNLKEFDHAMNCYAFTQHESPELQASLTWKGYPQDWVILLLVKSRGDFLWGDAGDLFFVIHKSDLAKKDFSKIFVTMESS